MERRLILYTCRGNPESSLFQVLSCRYQVRLWRAAEGTDFLSGINLSLWGIPEELQLRLDFPVEKVADWYFYEQQPEVCRIAYCPTGNSVWESDFKLISFVQKTNALLTIVSDRYRGLAVFSIINRE